MKLKTALGFISEKYKEPSVCEACGEEFTCGATVMGCWCTELKLTDEARAELKSQYKPACAGNVWKRRPFSLRADIHKARSR